MKGLVVLLVVVVLALVGYGVLVALAQPAPPHPYFEQWRAQRFPIVIAHRGGKGLWPENTLYAFERAAAMGVDMLDMDVRSTADGVLVLMRDPEVNRTTDGTGLVTSLTLEKLQALDAGHNWSSDGGTTFPFRDQRITVPTLEEVFSALPDVHMSVEIKQSELSLANSLCMLIREYGMKDKALVGSIKAEPLEQFRRECPTVATAGSEDEVRVFVYLNLVFLGAMYQPDFSALQVGEYRSGLRIVTPFFMETAHNRNMRVYVRTTDEEEDMQTLVNLSVDGIITGYPDRVLGLLGR